LIKGIVLRVYRPGEVSGKSEFHHFTAFTTNTHLKIMCEKSVKIDFSPCHEDQIKRYASNCYTLANI
jgi:hypothetical protein